MSTCGPLVVRCVWAPTGLHLRMIISNTGDVDVVGLRIDARAGSGHRMRLLPGNHSGGRRVDLTHVPAHGSIWMNAEPIDKGPVSVTTMVVALHADGMEPCHLDDIPIEG